MIVRESNTESNRLARAAARLKAVAIGDDQWAVRGTDAVFHIPRRSRGQEHCPALQRRHGAAGRCDL